MSKKKKGQKSDKQVDFKSSDNFAKKMPFFPQPKAKNIIRRPQGR